MTIALHTEQLQYMLTHLVQDVGKVDTLGVFPADCIPSAKVLRVRSRDVCFIANTDPHGSPGAHWLAFYYRARYRTLEYFDSYGLPLSLYKTVAKSFTDNSISIRSTNTVQLQALDSSVCGFYCVLFLRLCASYSDDLEGAKKAVEKIRKLSSESCRRDGKVVERLHKVLHEHSCVLPKPSSFTRQTQACCSYNVKLKRKTK